MKITVRTSLDGAEVSIGRTERTFELDGGDGGELNSGTPNNPIVLVFSLVDQISAMGDTAKQLKSALTNTKPNHNQTLSNILKVTTTADKV